MAVTFLCNLFWWNPFVYLLRRKLDEILEFKCDLTVVANMDNVEKACYLSTILSSLERTPDSLTPLRRLPNACLVAPSKKELLKKRFLLVAAPTKARTTIQNQIIRFLYIALAVVTLTGSYAFILQPKYETPKDKIITTLNTYESTPENTWLIQDMEGRYFLCNSYDKEAKELSYETAQMMLENGFIIKENGSR